MSAYQLKTFSDIYTAVMEELKLQSGDSTSKNRIKRMINMVYLNEVVPFDQWKWSRGKITLPIEPFFNTGTASVVQHSTDITLSSAPGPSKKGYYFSIDGQSEIYRIRQHTAGSTSVYLETPFIGSTATASSFKIWTDALPLPTDCQETFEVTHNYYSTPLEGRGLQEFRRLVLPSPTAQGYPLYYSTTDFVDPVSYSTISSLPALSTRASSNQVKTLVFASDVSSYLTAGNRIEITNAGHYSYNGEFVISSVSTTTVTFTGPLTYNESATIDASLTVKLRNVEDANERYREMLFYPSLWDKRIILNVDYLKIVPPLENDTDEPLIPIEDRIVLFYGALMMAWSSIGRNPEEAQRNSALFERKLAKMAGKLDDSTDLPQLKPSLTYLRTKRSQGRSKDTRSVWGGVGTGGSSTTSTTVEGLANSVAIFNNSSQLQGSTTVSTTELGYLDGVTSPIQTQINAINTLASGKIYLGDGSNVAQEVTPSGDVTITNAGVTAITAGVITDSKISASAAITRSKIASGTANHVIINDGTGVLSSEASLLETRGGTHQTTYATGDTLYASAANTLSKLTGNITSTKNFLTQTGSGAASAAPAWGTIAAGDVPSLAASIITSGTFAEARGGTNQSTYTTGDTLYASGSNTLSKLALGTAGQAYRVVNSQVAWSNLDWSAQIENLTITTSVGSNALTIAVKNKAASDASASSPIYVGFRNATAATGTYTQVAITGALSVVVPSGATLGLVSAQNEYIYVYLINNAGTAELMVVGGEQVFDDGSVVTSSTIGAGSTSRFTAYSTTGRSSVACRLIARLKSNQSTSGTYAANTTEISLAPFKSNFSNRNYAVLYTGAGHGSGSTKIRRFTNSSVVGTAITYPGDSSTLGAVLTIAEAGLYTIHYSDKATAASAQLGISVNSTQLTTSIESANDFFASGEGRLIHTISVSSNVGHVGFTFRLKPGDIVRPHTDGGPNDVGAGVKFIITKISD